MASQSRNTSGSATASASAIVSSASMLPRMAQHIAYSSTVTERLTARALWYRMNCDLFRRSAKMASGISGPRKIAPR
jgi:hypothetical protein